MVEFLDGADEAEVALLHQIQQRHAGALIALGDVHDEAQVRDDEHLLGVVTGADREAQPTLVGGRQRSRVARMLQGGRRDLSGGDDLGQTHFVVAGQKLVLRYFSQVSADEIVCRLTVPSSHDRNGTGARSGKRG